MCADIDRSAHSQLAGVDQLSASAAERARDAEALSGQSRSLEEIALASLGQADRIAGQSSTTGAALGKLHDSLFGLMTQTRPHDSDDLDIGHPILLRVTLAVDGKSFSGETIEFGLDGALLRIPGLDERAEGRTGTCRIEHVGSLAAEILRVDRLGVHVHFERPSSDVATAAGRALAAARAANQPLVERAVAGAADVSQAMENALAAGELSLDQLFDTRYQPIGGTDPQQYANRALPVLERILTPIQERIKASDQRMTFCCSVDLNGYLPVHNRIYSQPQRANDAVWNTANCRNKRIFNDRAGLAAARNAHPWLVHLYARDMGGGKFVMMKEIYAPIVVNGRHWGGFRTSYAI
jgi:methyl-accepting chemotaxis protein